MRPSLSSGRTTILGQPDQLFVLFFTEMWERFSFYGMRALLVLFLISSASEGGWGWSRAEATSLYGWYSMLVYLTPLIGGYLADRYLGTRRAVVLGGFIIAVGHISFFLETVTTFYLGLALVIVGTGLFKPNVSAIVGQLYGPDNEKARDGGYTLFYMGINAGAFFGIALCGYIGEKVSWSLGFGLAGLFMILGALQFYFGQHMFGDIGLPPGRGSDPSKGLAAERDETPAAVVRDRLHAIVVLSFFTIFFWFAFEQAGGSMTIFAADYTQRSLEGGWALTFKIVHTLITVIPAAILSWLLLMMVRIRGRSCMASHLMLVIALALIWGVVLWMLAREFSAAQTEVPATWFGVLNSFFIVLLAPLFSRFWMKYWNPSGPVKFAAGLVLLGLGFGVLAYGASGIDPGAKVAQVSMVYLILAYLLHTMGELCLSPVGLSYISKLAPKHLLSAMFGIWFLNAAVAAWIAGATGSYIDDISSAYSMSGFFMIFALIPALAGLLLLAITPWLKKKMHDVQ